VRVRTIVGGRPLKLIVSRHAMATPSRLSAAFRGGVVFLLSLAFAVAGTIALALLANARNWCCVHSWALAHGTGPPVLLLFGLLGYHVVLFVGTRLRWLTTASWFGFLAHVAYVGGAVGTLYFTRQFVWLGLLAGLLVLIRRLQGHAVAQFGLGIFGFVVSILSVAMWINLRMAF
jgi:hypothetical protein